MYVCMYVCLLATKERDSRELPGQSNEAEQQGCGELAGRRKLCLSALHATELAEPPTAPPMT